MDAVKAMCKAKDLVLQNLEKRCKAAEARCKALENQRKDEILCNLESESASLRARINILSLENEKHRKGRVDALGANENVIFGAPRY